MWSTHAKGWSTRSVCFFFVSVYELSAEKSHCTLHRTLCTEHRAHCRANVWLSYDGAKGASVRAHSHPRTLFGRHARCVAGVRGAQDPSRRTGIAGSRESHLFLSSRLRCPDCPYDRSEQIRDSQNSSQTHDPRRHVLEPGSGTEQILLPLEGCGGGGRGAVSHSI